MYTAQAKLLLRQISTAVQCNMKARYRGSYAGFLWVIMNPLLLYSAQVLVFMYILKIQVPNYLIYFLSGLLPWLFIVQSIEMSVNQIVGWGRLYKSFPIHPFVSIAAQVLDNFINMVALALILAPIALYFGLTTLSRLIFLPLPLMNCLVAALGLAWLCATLQIFFRDVRFVVSFVFNIGFYLTPIIYPEEMVPAQWRWLFLLNPFRHLITPFRELLLPDRSGSFTIDNSIAAAVGLCFLGLAFLYWSKVRTVAYFRI